MKKIFFFIVITIFSVQFAFTPISKGLFSIGSSPYSATQFAKSWVLTDLDLQTKVNGVLTSYPNSKKQIDNVVYNISFQHCWNRNHNEE